MKGWGKTPKKTVGATAVAATVFAGAIALNQRSLDTLAPTSPRMQSVAFCAAEKMATKPTYPKIGFVVYHGLRSESEQRSMIAKGVSWVNRSRHQDGDAIDIMATLGGKGTWDLTPYYEIAQAFYSCGEKLSVPITWGCEWRVKDCVHFEIRK